MPSSILPFMEWFHPTVHSSILPFSSAWTVPDDAIEDADCKNIERHSPKAAEVLESFFTSPKVSGN